MRLNFRELFVLQCKNQNKLLLYIYIYKYIYIYIYIYIYSCLSGIFCVSMLLGYFIIKLSKVPFQT